MLKDSTRTRMYTQTFELPALAALLIGSMYTCSAYRLVRIFLGQSEAGLGNYIRTSTLLTCRMRSCCSFLQCPCMMHIVYRSGQMIKQKQWSSRCSRMLHIGVDACLLVTTIRNIMQLAHISVVLVALAQDKSEMYIQDAYCPKRSSITKQTVP